MKAVVNAVKKRGKLEGSRGKLEAPVISKDVLKKVIDQMEKTEERIPSDRKLKGLKEAFEKLS